MNFVSQFSRKTSTLVAIAALALASACKGPQGDVGPAGTNGVNGTNGKDGNANVVQITFGEKTHSGTELTYTLTGITQAQLNGSAYFTYVRPNNSFWYSLPGTTSGGSREYRTYVDATGSAAPRLLISRVAGSGSEVFSTTRIVIIPAGVLVNGRQAAIDFNDYEAVKKAYNLPD